MLHALQEEFGCVDGPAIPLLAEILNLSQAEVHGVVAFYEDFRTTRPGHHVIKVCRAEACQAMGAEEMLAHAKAHLSVDRGETTADGEFTLETVFCLGNCALSPAVMIDETLHGRVDADRFEDLVKACREGVAA
jgi:formate dehydrogenase subunit gamma